MSSKTFSGVIVFFAFFLFLPIVVPGASSIDINTAPSEELKEIIGIGPALAQRIIEARPFNSLDDLIRVKGIGEKTLQKIKEQGLAYVENQAMQPILQTPIETPPETPREALAEPLDVLPTETPPQVVVPIVYPTGIVINEILPSPEGADAENEWIVPTNKPRISASS